MRHVCRQARWTWRAAYRRGWHSDLKNSNNFCVDERGWVWTTAADGIHVWSAERERLGHIPTLRVASNCCFGAPGMRRLSIVDTEVLLAIDLREAA